MFQNIADSRKTHLTSEALPTGYIDKTPVGRQGLKNKSYLTKFHNPLIHNQLTLNTHSPTLLHDLPPPPLPNLIVITRPAVAAPTECSE